MKGSGILNSLDKSAEIYAKSLRDHRRKEESRTDTIVELTKLREENARLKTQIDGEKIISYVSAGNMIKIDVTNQNINEITSIFEKTTEGYNEKIKKLTEEKDDLQKKYDDVAKSRLQWNELKDDEKQIIYKQITRLDFVNLGTIMLGRNSDQIEETTRKYAAIAATFNSGISYGKMGIVGGIVRAGEDIRKQQLQNLTDYLEHKLGPLDMLTQNDIQLIIVRLSFNGGARAINEGRYMLSKARQEEYFSTGGKNTDKSDNMALYLGNRPSPYIHEMAMAVSQMRTVPLSPNMPTTYNLENKLYKTRKIMRRVYNNSVKDQRFRMSPEEYYVQVGKTQKIGPVGNETKPTLHYSYGIDLPYHYAAMTSCLDQYVFRPSLNAHSIRVFEGNITYTGTEIFINVAMAGYLSNVEDYYNNFTKYPYTFLDVTSEEKYNIVVTAIEKLINNFLVWEKTISDETAFFEGNENGIYLRGPPDIQESGSVRLANTIRTTPPDTTAPIYVLPQQVSFATANSFFLTPQNIIGKRGKIPDFFTQILSKFVSTDAGILLRDKVQSQIHEDILSHNAERMMPEIYEGGRYYWNDTLLGKIINYDNNSLIDARSIKRRLYQNTIRAGSGLSSDSRFFDPEYMKDRKTKDKDAISIGDIINPSIIEKYLDETTIAHRLFALIVSNIRIITNLIQMPDVYDGGGLRDAIRTYINKTTSVVKTQKEGDRSFVIYKSSHGTFPGMITQAVLSQPNRQIDTEDIRLKPEALMKPGFYNGRRERKAFLEMFGAFMSSIPSMDEKLIDGAKILGLSVSRSFSSSTYGMQGESYEEHYEDEKIKEKTLNTKYDVLKVIRWVDIADNPKRNNDTIIQKYMVTNMPNINNVLAFWCGYKDSLSIRKDDNDFMYMNADPTVIGLNVKTSAYKYLTENDENTKWNYFERSGNVSDFHNAPVLMCGEVLLTGRSKSKGSTVRIGEGTDAKKYLLTDGYKLFTDDTTAV